MIRATVTRSSGSCSRVGGGACPRCAGWLCGKVCSLLSSTFGSGNERGRCPPGGGSGFRSQSLLPVECVRTGPTASRLWSPPSSRRATSHPASHLQQCRQVMKRAVTSTVAAALLLPFTFTYHRLYGEHMAGLHDSNCFVF